MSDVENFHEKKELAEKYENKKFGVIRAGLTYLYREKKKELICRIYSHKFAYREWLQEEDMSRYECIRCGREEKV